MNWMIGMNWIEELRITHSVKNLLIFMPLFFSGSLFNLRYFLLDCAGFLSFSFMCAAIYMINDIYDIEKDRAHPVKKNRPIASGKITIKEATSCIILLISTSLIMMICVTKYLNASLPLVILASYFIINIFYSIGGYKNIPLLDIALLVSGFYFRVLEGSALTGFSISIWMYLVVICGAFYLAFGKRRNELRQTGTTTRKVLSLYSEAYLTQVMNSCMTMMIVFFSLWCVNDKRDMNRQWFLVSVPLFMLICFKYNMDLERKDCDGDPMNTITSDKLLILLTLFLGIVLAFYIYMNI